MSGVRYESTVGMGSDLRGVVEFSRIRCAVMRPSLSTDMRLNVSPNTSRLLAFAMANIEGTVSSTALRRFVRIEYFV